MKQYRSHILVCVGTGCQSQESSEIIESLQRELKKENFNEEIQVVKTGCFGFCEKGPIIKILPENVFYVEVRPDDAKEIVQEHIVKGRRVERLLYEEPNINERLEQQKDMPFYKKQVRIALRNCGLIDPENIKEYIAEDGYMALGKVLTEMSQEEVIRLVKDSGLRGRGGGGFSTGFKWELTYRNKNDQKYIVCNADEGDPGAFMDRSILEGDPHSVLEAMAIGAYAIGADKGFIYIRAEYPLAINRLKIAIDQARTYGFLGKNIFESNFNFDVEIKQNGGFRLLCKLFT